MTNHLANSVKKNPKSDGHDKSVGKNEKVST